jgi:D-alanyl-lipoteichoic acid acyltransferase DltB (MBOAT superfamily)
LLAASYYFYGCWDWRFLGLIIISTLVDYVVGLAFDVKTVNPDAPPERSRRHRLLLFVSLATNLGILGFFKYYNFFIESAQELLAGLGIPWGGRPFTSSSLWGLAFTPFKP